VAYNLQIGKNKIKLLMECESVTQNVSFGRTRRIHVWEKVLLQENATCELWLFETKSLIKM
jgi:hypothetical protein